MEAPLRVHRTSSASFDWKPSPIVALATTSVDDSQVAAAREDGSLELWTISPGSTTWHCQLTIQGDSDSRVSSLVWYPPTGSISKGGSPSGRLLSSSIDGSISEWDIFELNQKIVLDSIGVSIWKMAIEPIEDTHKSTQNDTHRQENGYANMESADSDDDESSEIDDDVHSVDLHVQPILKNQRLAVACDDGCIRLYVVPDSGGLTYNRSFPRASGRALSVVWSLDAKLIFSGSSDGFIRCWDANLAHEIYRITVGHGGFGNGPELCIWSLLFLRSGTLVSADSSGSVQFWESQRGTMLQTHSLHKGDVNALAAAPSHNRVFSAGSDGQVILYKFSSDASGSGNDKSSTERIKKWVYVGYVRAHTHDIRALTVAMPINRDPTPCEKVSKKIRRRKKPVVSSYHKWAHSGNPMLISAGDDTKLFSYSVKEFTKFDPHDICPAPQRVPMQLVLNTTFGGASLILVQCSSLLVILRINVKSCALPGKGYGGSNTTQVAASIKSKAERKILCSAISFSGVFFAFSDNKSPRLFELTFDMGKSAFRVNRRSLPRKLPYAHSMVFSNNSSQLIIAGHDKKIYVVNVESAELLHTFIPCRKLNDNNQSPTEPPITKLFTSSNGQWLAAINCFGDIYVFNLKTQRQHWFISRLDGASVTAGGFPPSNSNMLIITTASNQVWAFDVESKQLAEWSKNKIFTLPREFQEFPSEVIGLSFPPSTCSTSVTIYSARSMCSIDYGLDDKELKKLKDNASCLANGSDLSLSNKKELKRKYKDIDIVLQPEHKQSEFKNPLLFVGHLSENSVFVMEKPWKEVIQTFDAPVHRHVFGT